MTQESRSEYYVKQFLTAAAEFRNSKKPAEVALLESRLKFRLIVSELVNEVTGVVGQGQREGVRVTALALGYKVEDKGSIADMTKELIKAAETSAWKAAKVLEELRDDKESAEEHNNAKAD